MTIFPHSSSRVASIKSNNLMSIDATPLISTKWSTKHDDDDDDDVDVSPDVSSHFASENLA